jgi:hypothetical protein
MNAKPSPYLPDWALRYFERHRDRFDDPEEMAHRRDAFYRLLCADADNFDMRRVWERAAHYIAEPSVCHFIPGPRAADDYVTDTDMEAEGFMCALIFASDEMLEDTDANPPRQQRIKETRLRDPVRTLARKLARLLREWRLVTPPRCLAKDAPVMQHAGSVIEGLVIAYDFELTPADMSEIYRRNGIEYTADSKRGWVQRRRASDAVRAKVISAAHKLVEIGRPQDSGDLARLAYNLRLLPDLKSEHVDQLDEPAMRSNKTGWPDWLRVAHSNLNGVGERDGFLRLRDWAALVQALYGETVSEERIGQVLRSSD